MMDEMIQISRGQLVRIAIVRHVRLAYGGGEIPNGFHCTICEQETADDAKTMHPEDHGVDCPLYKKEKK